MKRAFRKIRKRAKQFKKHPITKRNRARALMSYIFFNIVVLFKNEIIYNWLGGLKIYIRKGDAGIVGNLYFGLYEFNESMFLLHFLREDDVFLDIGSNLGHYSLLASGIHKCKSIAIEPIPKTYKQLLRQINLNNLAGYIKALNIGVSSENLEMYFSTNRGTMNRIVTKGYNNSIKIPVKTVDSIINEDINLIKIDVEGYEKFVLLGCKETLQKSSLKAIIIEINESGNIYNIKNEEIENILFAHGFIPFKYDPINRKLINLNSYNKEQFNTIFIRDYEFVKERILKSKSINIWNKKI
ncbi:MULTISPECIES: FkbM family methyltransferase [Flavobacteriaceae]|nr:MULTISPECIES: FkbM family methyltransferase [Flavobacteriaceae]